MDKFLNSEPPFSLYGDQLLKLIELLPFSAHLRDVETNQYVLANQFQAKNNGFERVEEVIGLTPADLHAHHRRKISKFHASLPQIDAYYKLFAKFNYQAETQQSPISLRDRAPLNHTGFLYVGMTKKMAILGNNQKTVAIFTLSEEITQKIDLADLYYLYKKYYPKKIAIQKFLTYLGINDYFRVMITDSEVLTLLAMRQVQNYKLAKDIRSVKTGTVETHVWNIKKKLKNPNALSTLLMALRNVGYQTVDF